MFGSFAKVALGVLSLLMAAGSTAYAKPSNIETDVHTLRAFNLELPYVDEGFQMRNYDFGGDAVVNTLGYIRLTPDLPSRVGWVWSTVPLPEDYWKIEFEFKIGGKGGYLYGDGMGFFVTKERASAGPVFGNRDYFNGLGVFFDTYPNGKHDFSTPFVMGMIGDGKTAYDGAHDGDANRLGMCEAYFRNLKSSTKVAVTYYKGHFINVQLKLQPKDKWINCFTITNATIPDGSYLGFTALTGEISDSHDLISVHAETLRAEALENYNFNPAMGMPAAPPVVSGSLFGFVFKLLLLVGVCAGVFVGYKKYSTDSARRF